MKNEKYYVGLDIGTDSVGYAVTNEQYELCKYKGDAMWGVTLFDPAQLAVERRNFRVARRRLDRRQQRVALIQDLFAREIEKIIPAIASNGIPLFVLGSKSTVASIHDPINKIQAINESTTYLM